MARQIPAGAMIKPTIPSDQMVTDKRLLYWPSRLKSSCVRVCLTIEGDPLSKQRPRFTRNKGGSVYTPKHTKQAEEAIQWAIKLAHRQLIPDSEAVFGVRAVFHCVTRQRRDLDNMCKLIFDACNKLVWDDDRQVQELFTRVHRESSPGRTELCIYTIGQLSDRLATCEVCEKKYKTFPSWKNRTAKSIEYKCEQCGSLFRRPRSLHKAGRKFCNETCLQAWWVANPATKKTYGPCESCGTPVSRQGVQAVPGLFLSAKKVQIPRAARWLDATDSGD